MTGWTTCPDCGWNFGEHGDTHRWRFRCERGLPGHRGGLFQVAELNNHNGTTTEAQAILQQERVKAIMAATGMNFAEACNQYIKEKYPEPTFPPGVCVPGIGITF